MNALLETLRARVALALLRRRVGSFSTSILSPRNPIQTVTATPANPVGTASATFVMMGLAIAFTPKTTGRIAILIQGTANNNTSGDGVTVRMTTGTGTAPVNGVAFTGTAQGNVVTWTALTGLIAVPMHMSVIVPNLTVNVPIWLDLAVLAITGGTASVANLNISVWEF